MYSRSQRFTYHFIVAAAVLLSATIIMYRVLGQEPLSHSVYDSYTRQAQSWWQGRISLPENVSWLELAQYNGRYYVSFPPFPSVVQFLLYPLFGPNTPNNLVNTLFGLGAFVLIYRIMMREGHDGFDAAVVALLFTLGSNLFYLSLTGWVWFSAQTQAFFFSALAVYLIDCPKGAGWAFLSLGLAFACRPPVILYAPLLWYRLYRHDEATGMGTFVRRVRCVLPLVLVGLCVAAYNYVRFENPLEFGHNYLPEFSAAPQFSLSYVPGNFLEILKLPGMEAGSFWPHFNGTLFFLVNPAYVLLGVRLAQRGLDRQGALYLVCLIAHLLLTLSHRTMGGWQFGCRYLVDMLPFMLLVVADKRIRFPRLLTVVLAFVGIVVNIWGAVWFYTAA